MGRFRASGMRARAGLVTIAAILLVIALGRPAPAPAAPYWQSCYPPSVFLHASLRAHDVHCGKARNVIEGFMRKAQAEGPDVSVSGFHCAAVGERVSCNRGDQSIKLHGVAG